MKLMKTLEQVLNEIDQDNIECNKEGYEQTLYRVFRGNGVTGEETDPLFRGMQHPMTILKGSGILANRVICCKEGAENMLTVEFGDIVKITKDKDVIWQHPNYHMQDIKFKDVMRKKITSDRVIPIGENQYRSEPMQVLDKHVVDDITIFEDGYRRTRVFYLENRPSAEIYEINIYSDTDLKNIDKKTENIIKYIKGERNKA